VEKEKFVGKVNCLSNPYNDFIYKKGIDGLYKRGYKHFHPSSFGECTRKVAFEYYSESSEKLRDLMKKSITAKFMRICDAGHAFHHRMQKSFAEMNIIYGYWKCTMCGNIMGKEEPLGIKIPKKCSKCNIEPEDPSFLFEYNEIILRSEDEYNFKGNCDGVVEDENNEKYIVDFKTINNNQYGFLSRPNYKYTIQVNIYMWLSGIKKAIIYYENKDSHDQREFLIPYNEVVINEIKDKSVKLKKLLENKSIPKREESFVIDKKPCSYCCFSEVCYKKS